MISKTNKTNPQNHPFTTKIITAYDEKFLRTDTDLVLPNIRQHFWILHGR